jgi:hypothetical protein
MIGVDNSVPEGLIMPSGLFWNKQQILPGAGKIGMGVSP